MLAPENDAASSVWPESDHQSAFSKLDSDPAENWGDEKEANGATKQHTEEELDRHFALPRSTTQKKKWDNVRAMTRGFSMFSKHKFFTRKETASGPPANEVFNVKDHIVEVEKKLIQLAADFDRGILKGGATPEQKLCPTKTGGYFGFKNILVYGVDFKECDIDVCFQTFYEGVFQEAFATEDQRCPFYSGYTEPQPSTKFPGLESGDASNFIYHWIIAAASLKKSGEVEVTAKVDTYMRLRMTCFDDELNEMEWSPEKRRESKVIVVSGCSVDSAQRIYAPSAGCKRLEFDVYGYLFFRHKHYTRVYHMNHIGKGLKLDVLQSAVNIMTRKKRNKEACQRELQRFSKFKEWCVDRQKSRDFAEKSRTINQSRKL
jgi:hypothetical protein